MKSKILIIDVGTHHGQELDAIFRYKNVYILYLYLKRKILSLFIGEQIVPKLAEVIKLCNRRHSLITKREDFYLVAVEPNFRNLKHPVYNFVDSCYPVALTNNASEIEFDNLYHKTGEGLTGQGATLFDNTIISRKADQIIICHSESFFKSLKSFFDMQDIKIGSVILRINCEGTEDEVIYACHKHFKDDFTRVYGSLKDVREKKGQAAMDILEKFLHENSIIFNKFSSNMSTWPNALESLHKYFTTDFLNKAINDKNN